jgi:hypothetical protein
MSFTDTEWTTRRLRQLSSMRIPGERAFHRVDEAHIQEMFG